jgi:hypothetical protein
MVDQPEASIRGNPSTLTSRLRCSSSTRHHESSIDRPPFPRSSSALPSRVGETRFAHTAVLRGGPSRCPLCAESQHVLRRGACKIAANGRAEAEVRARRKPPPAMDESQEPDPLVGALLLGHQSSHQRANPLTAAPGVKQQSRRLDRARLTLLLRNDLSSVPGVADSIPGASAFVPLEQSRRRARAPARLLRLAHSSSPGHRCSSGRQSRSGPRPRR